MPPALAQPSGSHSFFYRRLTTSTSTNKFVPQPVCRDQFSVIADECAEEDWDGNDASPISQQTAVSARMMFLRAKSFVGEFKPHVAPGADGTIVLEYFKDKGKTRKIIIEARPDNLVRCYWVSEADVFTKFAASDENTAIANIKSALLDFKQEYEEIE